MDISCQAGWLLPATSTFYSPVHFPKLQTLDPSRGESASESCRGERSSVGAGPEPSPDMPQNDRNEAGGDRAEEERNDRERRRKMMERGSQHKQIRKKRKGGWRGKSRYDMHFGKC